MECNVCGISYRKERLLEAVSRNGIVKICFDCSRKENLPILRKPTTFQLKDSEKNQTHSGDRKEDNFLRKFEKTETNLKDLVNKNYESRINSDGEEKPRPDLIDNFHWLIMRERRRRKLTQEQLAKEISESEAAIKMAEQGILPEDEYRLVNKIESFLSVKLVREEIRKNLKPEVQAARVLSFNSGSFKNITIDDLKKMKDQRESEIIEGEAEMLGNSEEEEHIVIEGDEELSEEEIDDILFRK